MDDYTRNVLDEQIETDEVARFTESYATFNRVINSLQRKYIELKDEFSQQNDHLVEANRKLVELGERNLVATEFLNSILGSVSAGVIAVDQKGAVTHFNPAASQILGMVSNEQLGKLYRDVVLPGEPTSANALRTVETGREVTSVEKKTERSDGSQCCLSVSTSVLRDSEGLATGAVEVFQDLTKIRKMEQDLARLNTLAALGEMAATVAHEVRNPLNGITGFATLLERDLDESDPRKDIARKIIRSVEILNNTVETLLDYSRSEEISRTEVVYEEYLKAVVEQFIENNRIRMEKTDIVLHPIENDDQTDCRLMLDRVLYRQVIFNILDNAVEVLKGKGTIEIRSRQMSRLEALSEYSESLALDIGETVVETIIEDDGPGIEPEHLQKIFSPFFSTRSGGNGLGLAVAWKIIKAHNGEIY
ncbi:MAG: ATP-binding protein, partial [candidate division Zixibacteria bacterium]|nr:ATP-binding protein [candidate division Zixibacteria bacterium]